MKFVMCSRYFDVKSKAHRTLAQLTDEQGLACNCNIENTFVKALKDNFYIGRGLVLDILYLCSINLIECMIVKIYYHP